MNEDAGQRLAKYVRERRNEVGLSQEDAATRSGGLVTTPNWRKIEAGERTAVRPRTALGLERALLWDRGSVEVILSGGEPTDSPHVQLAGLDRDQYQLQVFVEEMAEKVRLQIADWADMYTKLERRLDDVEAGQVSRLDALEADLTAVAVELRALAERAMLPDDDEEQRPGESRTGP